MIEVVGSSSKGNCYLIKAGGEVLIIDLGVHITQIKKALNHNYSNVVGCLVTHKHSDHSKNLVWCYKEACISSFVGFDCLESKGLKSRQRRVKMINYNDVLYLGSFTVRVLESHHTNDDGSKCECFSFLIHHEEFGNIFFATDTFYVPKLKNIDHIMIECNYSETLIDEDNLLENDRRRIAAHMGLENLLKLFSRCDLTKTKDITLLHLSPERSDPVMFKKVVEEETGIKTYIAEPGLIIE